MMQRIFTFDLDVNENDEVIGMLDCFELAESNTCECVLEQVYSPERGAYWLVTDNDDLTMQEFADKVVAYVEQEKQTLTDMVAKLQEALRELQQGGNAINEE
jgi:hypothetical protein